MHSKLSESKILQKIKDNKFKISLISGTLAAVLGISLGLGYAYNINAGNNTFGSGNPGGNAGGLPDGYVPEINVVPGEIKFDPNGKLLIPELVDEENPEGNYENKVDYTVEIKKEERESIINYNSESFYASLYEIENESKDKIKSSFPQEYLEKEITIENSVKNLMDYYIPDNQLSVGENFVFKQFIDILYKDAIDQNLTNTLKLSEASDLMALCGVNFDKEYNKIASEINSVESSNPSNISPRGGGGGYVPPVLPGLPPVDDVLPDPDYDIKMVTFQSQIDRENSDQQRKSAIEITFAAITIVISIAALVLAITSFVNWMNLILALIDLVFCGITLAQAVQEWMEHIQMIESYNRLDYNVKALAGEYNILSYCFSTLEAIDFFKNVKGVLNSMKYDLISMSSIFKRVKEASKYRLVFIKGSLSTFSFAVSTIKTILDLSFGYSNSFIEWIGDRINGVPYPEN